MRLLKAVFAGLFVLAAGLVAAVMLAVSALAVFLGRRLGRSSMPTAPVRHDGGSQKRNAKQVDAIDIEATEVTTRGTTL
jgi:hypothetical protein